MLPSYYVCIRVCYLFTKSYFYNLSILHINILHILYYVRIYLNTFIIPYYVIMTSNYSLCIKIILWSICLLSLLHLSINLKCHIIKNYSRLFHSKIVFTHRSKCHKEFVKRLFKVTQGERLITRTISSRKLSDLLRND